MHTTPPFKRYIDAAQTEYDNAFKQYQAVEENFRQATQKLERRKSWSDKLFLFGHGSTLYAHLGYFEDGRMVLGAYSKHDKDILSIYICPVVEETTKLKFSGMSVENSKPIVERMRLDFGAKNYVIKDKRK
jgi:hypothetical protein